MKQPHTRDELMAKFAYNPDTGAFTHRRQGGGRRAGDSAGSLMQNGYITITTSGGKHYQAHRLAWLFSTGEWPDGVIDHINGNKADNAFANLRAATHTQNLWNMKGRPSKSGLKGVAVRSGDRTKKYHAYIKINGVRTGLGDFETPEQAHAAYVSAATEHFGEFANAG